MKIENMTKTQNDGVARVSATVTWEDCDRPPQTVYYETDEAFAEDLTCDPHAFLVGSVLPARRHGEKRVAIDEVVCPELTEGLEVAMRWLDSWQGRPPRPVPIEGKQGIYPQALQSRGRAGAFLSGGLDSLALLRANRKQFPSDHPRHISDGLIVHGFDIGGRTARDAEVGTFRRALDAMSIVAEDAGVALIPVRTNVRYLDDGVDFWIYEFHGAALASVAHAFSGRFSLVSVAAGKEVPDIVAGSHPLLVSNYGSANLHLRVDCLTLSRLARAELISDWDVALQNLRVCTYNPPERLNCGVCEKCIRTMTELVAVGKLPETEAFGARDDSADLLETIRIDEPYLDAYYRELIEPLTEQGRRDLVQVIEHKLAEYQKYLAWKEEKDWKGALKRFDRRWLGGNLHKCYGGIRAGVIRSAPSVDKG